MLNPKYCCMGLFLFSYQAVAQAQVKLALNQWLDPNCQGTGLVEATRAEPGQCIRYQVHIKNSGSSVAQAVELKLPIPTHTILKQGLASQELNQAVANHESPLHTEIEQLEANEAVSLHYTVQVL